MPEIPLEVFAGAAFGENIINLFRLNNRTILVTEYQIEAGDTLNGLSLEDIASLPFKVHNNTIVVIKNLPVLECQGCTEYLLDDPVMQRVEEIIAKVDIVAELEVIKYAA